MQGKSHQSDGSQVLKIAIVNTSSRGGGAAIAARRLMLALRKHGADVNMLVRDKWDDDACCVAAGRRWLIFFRFAWERFVIWVNNRFSKTNLFAVSLANTGMDISRCPEIQEADIIHLHWVNQGFLSLKDIRKLGSLGKPLVWTMHDMWCCTGICHHARLCTNYERSCGNCFFLRKPGKNDLSHRVWLEKSRMGYENITFVACSRWLESKARCSSLMKSSDVTNIPNPIDTKLFRPTEKAIAKSVFSFEDDKFYILFGAVKLSDPRKGGGYFCQAIRLLVGTYPHLKEKTEVVFLGNAGIGMSEQLPVKVHVMGYLSAPSQIVNLYNAVDLFVTSSLEENLPNTIMEAMGCGTPVVGFATGGIPEMIDHKMNGYLARYEDSADLMQGIYWSLVEADYEMLRQRAREKVVNNYSEDIVGAKYMDLYCSLLEKNTTK